MSEEPKTAYKVLTSGQMAELLADGCFAGAPIDLADGYIHLSTAAQLAKTVAKHFAGQTGLHIAAVDLGSNSFRLQLGRVDDDQIYPLDSLREPVRLAQEFHAGHFRHALIADDDMHVTLLQDRKRLGTGGGREDLVLESEECAQCIQDAFLVVEKEDLGSLAPRSTCSFHLARSSAHGGRCRAALTARGGIGRKRPLAVQFCHAEVFHGALRRYV